MSVRLKLYAILFLFISIASCENSDDSSHDETTTKGNLTIYSDHHSYLYATLLASEFQRIWPDGHLKVKKVSTTEAIDSVVLKSSGFAIVSRDITESELSQEAERIVKSPVATDAIAFIVNRKNSVQNLTLLQLKDVLTGRIKNWKELGGKDSPITLFLSNPQDSQWSILKDSLLAWKATFSPNAYQCKSPDMIKEYVSKYTSGIGYVGMGTLRIKEFPDQVDTSKIKTIAIARSAEASYIPPTQGYVYKGDYLFTHKVHCAYPWYSRLSKGFSAFVLREGQKIFARNGIAPITLPYIIVNFKEDY